MSWREKGGLAIAVLLCIWLGLGAIGTASADSGRPHRIESGRLYGYIDNTGKVVAPPQFRSAWDFYDGLARVRPAGSDNFGYIGLAGEYIVPPELADAGDFSEGLAAVMLEPGGLYGYIDMRGEMVIPPRYYRAFKFHNGRARVNIDGMTAYIDRTGNELLRTPYIDIWDTDGDMIPFFEDRKMGFMNGDGKVVIEPQYSPLIYWAHLIFTAPITPVRRGDKYGFIDKTGKVAVDFQYSWVHQFCEGLAMVGRNKQYGFIDVSGKVVIPLQFEEAWNFSEGLAAVKVNGYWGFVDTQGRMVIEPQYLGLNFGGPIEFHEGLAAVRTENGTGYIDKQGEMVVPPIYRMAGNFAGGVAEVRFPAGFTGYINKRGGYLWLPRP